MAVKQEMEINKFQLKSDFKPTGDQPQAIEQLTGGLNAGMGHQVLLGVTGSGKTFTVANVIENVQKPTLVISHNKTLAAQLYQEFKEFFPENSVNYFVSYYDYYQPEAYVPQRDLYIEKEVDINKEIEKLRHSATQALMTRRDVIVVASVSCIYGLGRPEDYAKESSKFSTLRTAASGHSDESQNPNLVLESKMPDRVRHDAVNSRSKVMQELVQLLYERNDWDLERGTFRVRGDTIEVLPPYGEFALRFEFLGEQLSQISWIDPTSGSAEEQMDEVVLFAASHFITSEKRLKQSITLIEDELRQQLQKLKSQGKNLEAHRLKQRVEYDLELMEELGFCPGIENYSRYLTGREEGEPPYTLLDYFPDNYLCVIDESHMTIPQIRGMYKGDRARKETLVEHGFRLPSAMDNRPLRFAEFLQRVPQTVCTSATPGDWEIEQAKASARQIRNRKPEIRNSKEKSEAAVLHAAKARSKLRYSTFGESSETCFASKKVNQDANPDSRSRITNYGVVEQLIRPTGILDPQIETRPTENQIEDLAGEIVKRKERGERVLVTTLTKRMAEDLADYLDDGEKLAELRKDPDFRQDGTARGRHSGLDPESDKDSLRINACYLHSEVDTLERSDILADLRRGKYDVVVGINLLREGLDLPEVSLVAILDADKEGFLRSDTSLIQTMGRAARHIEGKVILYADKVTGSMRRAIDEVERRREVQKNYNEEHGIEPESIRKSIRARLVAEVKDKDVETAEWKLLPPEELREKVWQWEKEMQKAAEVLDFEKAAELRDKIRAAKAQV